jgi:hypothetical protein
LRSNGFLVVTKEGSPGDGKHYKANVDVMMAIYAVELSAQICPDRSLGDRRCRLRASSIAAPPARDSRGSSGERPNTLGAGLNGAANEVIDLVPLFETFDVMKAVDRSPD